MINGTLIDTASFEDYFPELTWWERGEFSHQLNNCIKFKIYIILNHLYVQPDPYYHFRSRFCLHSSHSGCLYRRQHFCPDNVQRSQGET